MPDKPRTRYMSQLDLNLIVLIILLACGIFSQNTAVTVAVAVLIVFRITPLSEYFPLLQQHGIRLSGRQIQPYGHYHENGQRLRRHNHRRKQKLRSEELGSDCSTAFRSKVSSCKWHTH